MKYYKYRHDNQIQKTLLKERINALNRNQRRNYKINNIVIRTSFVLYIIMLISLGALSIIGVKEYVVNTLLSIVFTVLFIVFSIVLPALIIFPITGFVLKKYPVNGLPRVIREMRIVSNKDYFKYYKIPGHFLITKIYDCSVKNLVNRDCMIYFHENKIRITNDFTTSSYDFGCYEFDFQDIELTYDRTSNLLTTVLLSKDIKIILGRRAKSYILKTLTH